MLTWLLTKTYLKVIAVLITRNSRLTSTVKCSNISILKAMPSIVRLTAVMARTMLALNHNFEPTRLHIPMTSAESSEPLLITEAGGMIGELDGNPDYLESGNVLAGNPRVYAALIAAFTPLLPASLKTAVRV